MLKTQRIVFNLLRLRFVGHIPYLLVFIYAGIIKKIEIKHTLTSNTRQNVLTITARMCHKQVAQHNGTNQLRKLTDRCDNAQNFKIITLNWPNLLTHHIRRTELLLKLNI